MSAGVTALVAGQATINIAGVVGLMPVTGLPLPLISDGGSALVVTLAMIGMLASFARAEPDAARTLHARPPGRLARILWAPLPPMPVAYGTVRRRRWSAAGRGGGVMSRTGRGGGVTSRKGVRTMAELRSVVLAGGGTGRSHLSAAGLRRLPASPPTRRPDHLCRAAPRASKSELIPGGGYDLRQVPAYQLPRSVSLDLAKTPTRMLRSMKAGREVLDDVEADVVVGFGGYVAVPAYLAAWRRHTPIVIHELNVPPGVANRLGMRFTKHVAVGFPYQPAVSPLLHDARVVGVPLRPAIATLDRAAEPAGRPGALRARPATGRPCSCSARRRAPGRSTWPWPAPPRRSRRPGIQVLHVIGARNEPVDIPPDLAAPYVSVPYIADMELGYAAADLVLSRGGAMTLAEVTTVGLPAIYVPLPYGNGEQRRNALPVVQAGGGSAGRRRRADPGVDREDGGPVGARQRRDCRR